MNTTPSPAIQRAKLFRKLGFGFFLFLIAWSIAAASTGVYRSLTSEAPSSPATHSDTP